MVYQVYGTPNTYNTITLGDKTSNPLGRISDPASSKTCGALTQTKIVIYLDIFRRESCILCVCALLGGVCIRQKPGCENRRRGCVTTININTVVNTAVRLACYTYRTSILVYVYTQCSTLNS